MAFGVWGIVVVGTSMGGLRALETLAEGLPAGFPLPVAVVQHRSPDSGDLLRMLLQRRSALKVVEPNDKEAIVAGRIYLAPPDYHLIVDRGSFSLSVDPPVTYARPSVDVLFETAADAYGKEVIGVVLTGANHDGSAGVSRIKAKGGFVVVQDPNSSESPVMPRSAIATSQADIILPMREIAPFLAGLCSYLLPDDASGAPVRPSHPPAGSKRNAARHPLPGGESSPSSPGAGE